MAKILRCRDIGFGCAGFTLAENEDEALAQAAEHAQTVHGLTEMTNDLAEAVRTATSDK